MTNDELIYAANEQLREYRDQIAERYHGKIVKAYGDKVFRVVCAKIDEHGGILL